MVLCAVTGPCGVLGGASAVGTSWTTGVFDVVCFEYGAIAGVRAITGLCGTFGGLGNPGGSLGTGGACRVFPMGFGVPFRETGVGRRDGAPYFDESAIVGAPGGRGAGAGRGVCGRRFAGP